MHFILVKKLDMTIKKYTTYLVRAKLQMPALRADRVAARLYPPRHGQSRTLNYESCLLKSPRLKKVNPASMSATSATIPKRAPAEIVFAELAWTEMFRSAQLSTTTARLKV